MSSGPPRRRRLLPGTGPLSAVSPPVAFVVVLAVFVVGVWWGGVVGAVLLGALAVFAATLLTATWHRLSGPDRTVRLVVLAVLVAVAVQSVS